MNIWTGLLFLEGAIADPALARELSDEVPAAPRPRDRAPQPPSARNPEKTMNLFKSLLYLIENDKPASPVLLDTRHYGAASAADELAPELGNRAASERLFGKSRNESQEPLGCH